MTGLLFNNKNKEAGYRETSSLTLLEKSKRYNQVCLLNSILGMIYQCQARINTELNVCENIYGSENGRVLGTQTSLDRILHNQKVIARLQKYYNNKISKLSTF